MRFKHGVVSWQDNGEEEEDPGKGCSRDWDTPGQTGEGEVGVGRTHEVMKDDEVGVSAGEPQHWDPSPEPEGPLCPQTQQALRDREQ